MFHGPLCTSRESGKRTAPTGRRRGPNPQQTGTTGWRDAGLRGSDRPASTRLGDCAAAWRITSPLRERRRGVPGRRGRSPGGGRASRRSRRRSFQAAERVRAGRGSGRAVTRRRQPLKRRSRRAVRRPRSWPILASPVAPSPAAPAPKDSLPHPVAGEVPAERGPGPAPGASPGGCPDAGVAGGHPPPARRGGDLPGWLLFTDPGEPHDSAACAANR